MPDDLDANQPEVAGIVFSIKQKIQFKRINLSNIITHAVYRQKPCTGTREVKGNCVHLVLCMLTMWHLHAMQQ